MTVAATTSDLYMERDRSGPALETPAPPPPPAAPQPVKVDGPVIVKHRMADEKPDGSMRDTSTEALRPGNEIGFRNVDDEALAAKQQEKAAPAEPPKEPPKEAVAPPTPEQAPEPKKYADKFQSVDELEKGYREAQKKLQETLAERDRLQREQTASAARPPEPAKPVELTPEQKATRDAEASRIVNEFVQDPVGFRNQLVQQAQRETLTALAAQQMTENWRKANPDLVEHEIRVAFEATQLIQTEPDLAKNPAALFDRATANFRQFTGKLRTEGAKEALTQETRIIPLTSSNTPPGTTGQPEKTPMTADEAYSAHLAMLKSEERKSHRGLRR